VMDDLNMTQVAEEILSMKRENARLYEQRARLARLVAALLTTMPGASCKITKDYSRNLRWEWSHPHSGISKALNCEIGGFSGRELSRLVAAAGTIKIHGEDPYEGREEAQ